MSGISSGIGLISGIDTATLIDQLIAIERRPITNLQQRVSALDIQRAAFMQLSAQLLAVQNSVTSFGRLSFFHRFSSTSSNEGVLTADASDQAAPGTYTFRVRSLVTNHSLISRGFADADTTPLGVGTLTIESARGRVNPSTSLDALNGGAGVRRGVMTITDRSGASAEIDLSTALTVDDVLNAINCSTGVNVRAYVTGVGSNGATGDRIVVEDLTLPEDIVGRFIIADVHGGFTASDLGIAAEITGGRVDGHDLVRLSNRTQLSVLNDGNGVGRLAAGTDLVFSTALGDFDVSLSSLLVNRLDTDLRMLNSGNGVRLGTIRITDRSGQSAEIDLSGASTVQDVLDAINAADLAVSASVVGVNGQSLFQLTDTSGTADNEQNPPRLIVEDVTGYASADLGLAGEATGESIQGSPIFRIDTIGDVINAINYANGNDSLVEASISEDGNGIVLRALGSNNTLTVTAGETDDGEVSTAAQDLGLLGAENVASFETRRLLGGLNTVLLQSLNGGSGVQVGEVRMTDRAGQTLAIDFSAAETLQDVVDMINLAGGTSLAASINPVGNGIVLRDESRGTGHVIIEDVTGSLAADLGIAGTYTSEDSDEISSGNLQRQYITQRTLLSDLGAGRGVTEGTFTITDSNSAVYTVVVRDTARTVQDVINAINRAVPDTIEARINDTGDGLVLIDTAGGSSLLTIEDRDGGRTAADLNLAGVARPGESFVDGSFEVRIAIDADDSLEDIAKKINDAGADASASVLHHGGDSNPYSLSITAENSGRAGELLVDAIGFDLGLTTLARAQDAIITIGDENAATPRVVSSSTNTVEGVVPGVTLNLLGVDSNPVTVSVAQDMDGIVEAIRTFVEKYNGVLDSIAESTAFDPDTLARGPLQGDRTVSLIRTRLVRLPLREFEGVDESVSRLFSIGLRLVRLGSDNQLEFDNRLEFDEERFREVYETSPEQIEELFTQDETGVGAVLENAIEELTRDFDGVISRKDDLLADQQELLNKRIGSLNILLDAKRARLEAQFIALESSLAALQAQQTALATLAQMAGGRGT